LDLPVRLSEKLRLKLLLADLLRKTLLAGRKSMAEKKREQISEDRLEGQYFS